MSNFRLRVEAELDAKKFDSQLNALKNKKVPLEVELKGLNNSKAFKTIEKLTKQTNNITVNVDVSGGKEISSLARDLKNLKSITQSINPKISINTSGGKSSVNGTINDFKLLKNLANEISKKKIAVAKLDVSKNSEQISTLKSQISSLESDYNSLYNTLSKNLSVSQIGELNQIIGKSTDRVDELNAKAKDMAKNAANISKPFNQLDATIASNKTLTWLENNSKAVKKLGGQFEDLAQKQKAATSQEQLADYNKKFRALTSYAQSQGLTGKSWWQDAKRAFGDIFEFAGMYRIIQNFAFEVPRQLLNAVKEVNASQIELAKVSDAPQQQLVSYWNEAAESAKKYGATISDVISSTADWSRLGYNLNDSKQLSDMTTLLQKVGDNMTQESASEGLISTLRGFELEADSAQKIVDVANQIANTQPIDTSGIFNAMQRSASSLNAAGNTFEQSVSLATAANSVVQDSDKIGTALKTISMRIRGAETDLENAGLDTEGMATSTAKLRKEVKALSGVDIMKNNNEFKSTYDILDELSNKWSSLNDIQQASVTELIAGGAFDSASIYRNINKRTYLIARAA